MLSFIACKRRSCKFKDAAPLPFWACWRNVAVTAWLTLNEKLGSFNLYWWIISFVYDLLVRFFAPVGSSAWAKIRLWCAGCTHTARDTRWRPKPRDFVSGGLAGTEADEEPFDFPKEFCSIQRAIPVDSESESAKQVIVEYVYGTAIQSLSSLSTIKNHESLNSWMQIPF